MSAHRTADENVQLDAGGGLWRGRHGEVEARAVDARRRDGDVQLVAQQLGAAAVAARARLGPRSRRGRRSARHVQRTGTSSGTVAPVARLARRQLDRRAQRRRRARRRGTRWRMRSTAGATDGKSMTTSSAKQLASWRSVVAAMTATGSPPSGRNVSPRIELRVR